MLNWLQSRVLHRGEIFMTDRRQQKQQVRESKREERTSLFLSLCHVQSAHPRAGIALTPLVLVIKGKETLNLQNVLHELVFFKIKE